MERKRVLIVEDDEIIRDFLADSLEMKGYAPSYASDGAEALEYMESNDVDLVVSDVKMPEMNGVTLSQRIGVEHPEIPVVLITGVHAGERDRILEQSGAVACLPKPLRIQHLCEVLEQACPPA